jgi:hypothetical protein
MKGKGDVKYGFVGSGARDLHRVREGYIIALIQL